MIRTDVCGIPSKEETPRHHEPNPSRDLEDNVESESGLVGHFGIMSGLRDPLLHNEAGRILYREGGSDVKQVQRPIGSTGQLLREKIGQNRVTQHGCRTGRRHAAPQDIGGQGQPQDQCQLNCDKDGRDQT